MKTCKIEKETWKLALANEYVEGTLANQPRLWHDFARIAYITLSISI